MPTGWRSSYRRRSEGLLQQAEAGHTEPLPGLRVADELALRQARLQQIGAVKAELEARAQSRYEQEQAAYEAKLAERQAKEQARGRKLGGRTPPTAGTSQIMPVSGGGFEQAYNAQVGVEHTRRLMVENHLSPNPNDKQERPPALDNLRQLPAELGRVNHVLTENGFFSEANVKACEQAGITPLIAMGRTGHHPTLEERFADPGEAPDTTDPVVRMAHRLRTPEGKALYAQLKSTVEPVFGIIKHVMGFRQFLLRGLQAVRGERNVTVYLPPPGNG